MNFSSGPMMHLFKTSSQMQGFIFLSRGFKRVHRPSRSFVPILRCLDGVDLLQIFRIRIKRSLRKHMLTMLAKPVPRKDRISLSQKHDHTNGTNQQPKTSDLFRMGPANSRHPVGASFLAKIVQNSAISFHIIISSGAPPRQPDFFSLLRYRRLTV
uniref:Uncharacterized protein n=1 Tax=Romanomermis culicivorax TaxID=13658 RepID=A0A915L3N3_ROMCU